MWSASSLPRLKSPPPTKNQNQFFPPSTIMGNRKKTSCHSNTIIVVVVAGFVCAIMMSQRIILVHAFRPSTLLLTSSPRMMVTMTRPPIRKLAVLQASFSSMAAAATNRKKKIRKIVPVLEGSVGVSASTTSKPRPSFRMPVDASNDSSITVQLPKTITTNKDRTTSTAAAVPAISGWNSLGLWTELIEICTQEMQCPTPTAVQQLVLPELLQEKSSHHVAFLAATGSGKTLAYALPMMQRLKQQEVFTDNINASSKQTSSSSMVVRPKQRPRGLILAPTRELALQIKTVLKQLSHGIKLSIQMIAGGEASISKQRQYLEQSPVDIIVATPGRLLQHVQDKTVLLNHLKFVVIDEMDTMMEQGFANELAKLLYPVLYHKQYHSDTIQIDPEKDLVTNAPSVWLTSATMTQSVQKMIGDANTDGTIQARKHYVKVDSTTNDTNPKEPQTKLVLPKMKVLRAKGLHKVVPTIEQVFVDVGNQDKLALLLNYVNAAAKKQSKTMIFCNTASACRAVGHALTEAGRPCLSYHGDLNSSVRSASLAQFRTEPASILVCTDLAARGLDVPTVDHVIMFDFPLNALDYLHRSGRTARGASRGGTVTALVTKRDLVLATAIERAVRMGEPVDGLSSRKSDYQIGGRLHSATGNSATNANRVTKRERPAIGKSTRARVGGSTRSGSFARGSATRDSTRGSATRDSTRGSAARGSARKNSSTRDATAIRNYSDRDSLGRDSTRSSSPRNISARGSSSRRESSNRNYSARGSSSSKESTRGSSSNRGTSTRGSSGSGAPQKQSSPKRRTADQRR